MDTVLWILAGLLVALFAATGLAKLIQPKEKLVASPNMAWAGDYSPGMLKTIGGLEVVAAAGLILPGVLDVATVLVPLAAVGLALLMVGAIITHARRGEIPNVAINVVLLGVAAVVAWGRFGPHELS
jgi:uncharacterized membrane protein YphA (DoxX/SURF4 family)